MLTPTALCETMNKVYETLKPMTPEQIKEASDMAVMKMPPQEAALFKHQCNYALMKKNSGAWK